MDKETKLKKLLSILTEWLNYSKAWKQVEVKEVHKNKRDYILVKYFDPKLPHFESTDFESIEFPIEDLDRRIEHYDSKVRNLKNKNNGESK